MRLSVLAFLVAPVALSAAACGRSSLDALNAEAGGGGAGGGSTTSTGGTTTTTTTTPTPTGPCGNGVIDPGEQCDDGNTASTDACLPSCVLAFCGDGVVHVGFEQCDDANTINTDGCVSCAVAFCGDGFVLSGIEQCDDANAANGDGCSAQCQLENGAFCGNGVIEPGEQCDDGNVDNSDACLKNCVLATCGDGIVHVGFEQCDDANNLSTDACIACAAAFCGDGFVRAGVEQCDDGNTTSGDGCSSQCAAEMMPSCGNGVLEAGEQCDDGNASNTDACLNMCVVAKCGDGFVQAGVEQCDDANNLSTDACVTGCKNAKCGDGFVQAGVEQCDDGNATNGDGCSSQCKSEMGPVCGNGVLDAGETCDLGPMNADRPAFRLTYPNGGQAVKPIVSPADAALFYNYFSTSGHTGFEVLNSSILFLYASSQTKALSLFVETGIDFTTTGQVQQMGDVTMDISGLPAASVVALADDPPNEFFKQTATTVKGSWHFNQNTDGGVISGLPFPGNWTITVTPMLPQGLITQWFYVDGGAMPSYVTMPPVGATAQIQAFDSPSACRLNCTVPKCGDNVLDGGEVCDDGNVISGDGCAADCKAF